MKKRISEFVKSILAGLMIGIGASVFLSCENKYVGATLFSIGLIAVVVLGFNLYTGKVGYLLGGDKEYFADTVLSIFGNLVGCIMVGLTQAPIGAVISICEKRLDKGPLEIFIDAIFCGILIFVPVEVYKRKGTFVGILIGIPTFILCGFEHSIADMFYFLNARMVSLDTAAFIGIAILGNAVGGLLIPALMMLNEKLSPTPKQ